MKNTLPILLAAGLFAACSRPIISNNKAAIDDLVYTRQVSKSIRVDSYRITHHQETNDSLILYIKGKGPDKTVFYDTIRRAKNANGTIALAK